MQSEIIYLTKPASQLTIDEASAVLKDLAGVSSASSMLAVNAVTVAFDEQIVNSGQLRTALARGGYESVAPKSVAPKSVHGTNGSCCGGCGG